MHQNLSVILDKERQDILPYLHIFRDMGFYLAGGTALSLMFGHRESEDFDFFCPTDIDTLYLFSVCREYFGIYSVEKIYEEKNTLWILVGGIKMSFFTLYVPLLEPLIHTQYVDIASLSDISAMKIGAIQQRATQKDYIDILYIIREIGISAVLENFSKKYGNIIGESLLLKSLVYFDDVDSVPIHMICGIYSWEDTKQDIISEVKKYMHI